MKKIITFVAGLMILTNVILLLLIETYLSTAMLQGCAVVLIGAIMLVLVQYVKLSDAYRYSLSILYSIATICEWLTSFFAPNKLINNWFVMVALVIFVIEIVLLLTSNTLSNFNSKTR